MNIRAKKLLILVISVMLMANLVIPASASSVGDSISGLLQGFSEWNRGQQEQFWGWVDNQTNHTPSTPAPSASAEPSPSSEPSGIPNSQPTTPSETPSAPQDEPTQTPNTYVVINGNGNHVVVGNGESQKPAVDELLEPEPAATKDPMVDPVSNEYTDAGGSSNDGEDEKPETFWGKLVRLVKNDFEARTALFLCVLPGYILLVFLCALFRWVYKD